jgi:predicted helicase
MTQTIHDILEIFREEAANNRDLGDKFERLIAAYLTKDPFYANHFSNVWLWMEWPGRGNKPDTGIDLVAEERATGDLTAIQCKFFDPAHYLQKDDIDSFFTESGKASFTQRMFFSTTDKWSKHAEEALNNQQIPVNRVRVQDLDDSAIDWSDFKINRLLDLKRKPTKKLRPHQTAALADVQAGLKKADRGKLIMACGTGKTFTALKIAESIVPDGGHVLFLVPSISLISQTLGEWSAESEKPLSCFAVCSDPKVGATKTDEEDITTHDLAYPAHTNPRLLVKQINGMTAAKKKNITVIFSTYQSIAVISDAQKKFGLPEFDLVVCDEAHRTTGVEQLELDAKEASCFIAVHNADYLRAKKRLYMTATPRIYTDDSKAKAKEAGVTYYSMDEVKDFGEELHRLDFSEAVRKDLLSDYKVLVLAVDQLHVSEALQKQFAKNKELQLEDAVKIVGCWNGLRKRFVKQEGDGSEAIDRSPMRRAVAFSSRIKDSQKITNLFAEIIKEYTGDTTGDTESENAPADASEFLKCEARHVDGKMNALLRNEALQWLKEDTTREGTVCRILSNARCLSEGVDVPALDAVMFLNPRKSVVDVVQSVGRVMRKSPGTNKQCGFIILPIGVPVGVPPDEALADNEKYKVVWQVLQALRAHDDRFNAIINQLELNKKRPDQIQIIGVGGEGERAEGVVHETQTQYNLNFPLQDWENAIFAKIVVKCGTRKYWEDWAKDVAKIAERHIIRITALLKSSDAKYRKRFDQFLQGLRKTLNPSISEDDAIEMLAQHLITKPVFDALFEGYEFTKQNPVSKTMQKMLDLLEEQNLATETETLEKFYESVRQRATGIDNARGKQKIIIELYDKFFKTAFPRMAERLGIVYTPVEVVDFIIKSVDDVLKSEFGIGLTAKNVHVLDPFTGTGTFIVRLIQGGIIADNDLTRKFREELHANEIILLAYYIAAINIEEAYHGRVKKDYEPFEGIVLTDTFQLSEGKGTFDDPNFQVNSDRATKQNKRDIRVIMGNPPYSKGQDSQNDNNQNLKYDNLDRRIELTYVEHSTSTNKNSLYDSYIRAVRWASDRVKDKGVICFVSNGGFIDANAMSGLRKCLMDEFASIYCFNLRGNQRTSGDTSRREGGKIFGSGSRAQIAITLLVKNPEHKDKCQLFYHDIGDYLSREEKLTIITEFGSIKNINWGKITPNKSHDWINQRDPAFEKFVSFGDKKDGDAKTVFEVYSRGLETSRDAWCYNFSSAALAANIKRTVEFYNEQVTGFVKLSAGRLKTELQDLAESFIDADSKKISWSRSFIRDLCAGKHYHYYPTSQRTAVYRPYCKTQVYLHRELNNVVGTMPEFFPHDAIQNRAIGIKQRWSGQGQIALMVDCICDLQADGGCQYFPLYLYERDEPQEGALISQVREGELVDGYRRRSAITDTILSDFRAAYGAKITKEDVFYYVYGVLHSPEYRTRFASDLKKMLPRIPLAEDFWAFSKAGRKLAEIHLNYETAKPYPVKEQRDELVLNDQKLYLVEKMRFGKTGKEVDKTKIQYNSHITLTGIPLAAYDYVVNGKPAIEWIMDRYQFSKDKDSQIINDPNDWPREHNAPQYILNLLKSIITVSLETMKIVNALPALKHRNEPVKESATK